MRDRLIDSILKEVRVRPNGDREKAPGNVNFCFEELRAKRSMLTISASAVHRVSLHIGLL